MKILNRRFIWKLRNKILCPAYSKLLRLKLGNTAFTILSNDCTGGCIYHQLRREFTSPTINLYMSYDDFFVFCENIKYYYDAKIIEKKDNDCNYPVGYIVPNNLSFKPLQINFVHYSNFIEAKESWERRIKRIIENNIIVVWNLCNKKIPISNNNKNSFNSLKCKKVAFCSKDNINVDGIKNLKTLRFNRKDLSLAMVMNYDKFGKQYFNQYNFVKLIKE